MNTIEPGIVHVSAIHNVDGTCFERNLVEDVDLVDLGMSDKDDGWNVAPQIEERVQFYGTFVFAEPGPREERQTQIDCRCVQSVSGLLQLDAEGFLGIELSGFVDQDLSKLGVDAPVSNLVGIGKGISRDLSSDAHVIESLLSCPQTDLDVSETFSVGELGKGHAQELVPA